MEFAPPANGVVIAVICALVALLLARLLNGPKPAAGLAASFCRNWMRSSALADARPCENWDTSFTAAASSDERLDRAPELTRPAAVDAAAESMLCTLNESRSSKAFSYWVAVTFTWAVSAR